MSTISDKISFFFRRTAGLILSGLNPRLGNSLKPFARTYYSFGRMLVEVFASLKLIERSHPWMRSGTKVRPLEVLSLAWARTDWRKPWQPVPVFVVSVSLLLFFGTFSFGGMMVAGAAGAGSAYAGLFTSPSESTDLALKYISNSFGVKVGTAVPMAATIDGVVEGFQQMMGIYSMAMLIVAGFILLYIILSSIATTAHEGRFGGNGFNQVWAPIRLVVAIGLLVPLPMTVFGAPGGFAGYNSGQAIVLKLSEWASGLATNLWVPFAQSLINKGDVIAMPNVEPAASVVRGVMISEFCMARHNLANVLLTGGTQPNVAIKEINYSAMHYVYYTTDVATTNQYCGVTSYERPNNVETFVSTLLDKYKTAYETMRDSVRLLASGLNNEAFIGVVSDLPGTGNEDAIWEALINGTGAAPAGFVQIVTDYQTALAQAVYDTKAAQESSSSDAMNALSTDVQAAGWAGAAMWFNTVARLNSEFMSAVRAMPMTAPPDLEKPSSTTTGAVDQMNQKVREGVSVLNQYLQGLPARLPDFGYADVSNAGAASAGGGDVTAGSVTAGLYVPKGIPFDLTDSKWWGSAWNTVTGATSAGIGNLISYIFSTWMGGPFGNMGTGTDITLDEVYPLADLAAIGDWMINRSFVLIGLGKVVPEFGDLIMYLGLAGAGAGIMLFYVLPLVPFIKFLFGVVGWLLNILEAIIAIPLVAVAHLTTGGQGLSGDLARTAYFLIFSVFLRPALLIVGLIVALMMFSVAVSVLNDMYKYAILGFRGTNTGEANGGLSVIMYTVLYTVIAYMLCNLCFHLIEEIPNRALTWINQAATKEVTQDESVSKIMTSAGDNIVYTPMKSLSFRK